LTAAADRRPLALQAVLVALIVLALAGGWNAATQRELFFSEFPRFTPGLWALYLGWVPVGIAAKVGMLLWRRWGFWLTLGGGLLVAGIELYVGMGPKTLRVLVSLLLVAALARPHWERFR
jgi:hypothetical protein